MNQIQWQRAQKKLKEVGTQGTRFRVIVTTWSFEEHKAEKEQGIKTLFFPALGWRRLSLGTS